MAKNGDSWKCEKCGKIVGGLKYERKNLLLCRPCALKNDGKPPSQETDDDDE